MDQKKSSINQRPSGISRRNLFRTAGLAAGGAMVLGVPKIVGNWIGEAEAALGRDSTANVGIQFALELDGSFAGFLKTVEGGNAFSEVIAEPPGPDLIQRKRPGPVRFEDIVLEVPLGGVSKELAGWISETLAKGGIPRNGAIVHTDVNHNEIRRLEFFSALITETSFPTFNAASKDEARLMLRIRPQSTHFVGGKGKAQMAPGLKYKPALSSLFRFNVQGLENACQRISKVDSIMAKRLMTKMATSQDKFRQPEAGASGVLDCSMITLTFPAADAGPFFAWFDDFALKIKGGERAGLLEWLSLDTKTVIGSVLFGGLGIVRVALNSSDANIGKVQTASMEMYCETVTLNIV